MKTIVHFLYGFSILALTGLVFQRCLWTPEPIDFPCHALTDIIPDGAHFGETVTIKGVGFIKDCPELYTISINGKNIPQEDVLSVPDENSLNFKVPKGYSSGLITVSLINLPDCSVSLNKPFTYYFTATKVGLLAGSPGLSNCPTSATDDFFNTPAGLDFDPNTGNVIVADKFHNLIRTIKPPVNPGTRGSIIGTCGKITINCLPDCNQNTVFQCSSASFRSPADIEIDLAGNIFVVEESSNAVIRLIKPIGSVEVFAGKCQTPGDTNGMRLNARLVLPLSMAKDGEEIYFTDAGSIRKIDALGTVSTFFTKPVGSFYRGIEISHSRTGEGPIFVTDETGHLIRFYDFSKTPGAVFIRNNNLLSRPVALTLDNKGNIFIADKDAHRIFVLYPNGELVSLAGGAEGYVDNQPGDAAQFKNPSGITLDQNNNIIYVSDGGNHAVRYIILE